MRPIPRTAITVARRENMRIYRMLGKVLTAFGYLLLYRNPDT